MRYVLVSRFTVEAKSTLFDLSDVSKIQRNLLQTLCAEFTFHFSIMDYERVF